MGRVMSLRAAEAISDIEGVRGATTCVMVFSKFMSSKRAADGTRHTCRGRRGPREEREAIGKASIGICLDAHGAHRATSQAQGLCGGGELQ